MDWTDALPEKQRRGSLPRCLRLMDGDRAEVAGRLSDLVALPEVRITADDAWMPTGMPVQRPDGTWDLSPIHEATRGEAAGFLGDEYREQLLAWWLAVRKRANTPNWDIASTCTVAGEKGLLLVEAKAHANEIKGGPKVLGKSDNSRANHEQIRRCIAEANAGLASATGGPWSISADTHYQLANRFAWSWKLTELGVPVVLMYLGFLNATEMQDRGEPFVDGAAWESQVRAYADGQVPGAVWNQTLQVNGQPFIALLRSTEVDL